MPQICTICRHRGRAEIDTALIRNESLRNIAEQLGTTVASLHRHRPHIPQALALASKRSKPSRRRLSLMVSSHWQPNWIGLPRKPRRSEHGRRRPAQFGRSAAAWRSRPRLEERCSWERTWISMWPSPCYACRRPCCPRPPDDFAPFWKEVIEKASEEQIAAAYAALPDRAVQKDRPDLSALTNEELQTLERIASKASTGKGSKTTVSRRSFYVR